MFQAKAVELHHHPERVKLEIEHRKSGDPKNYDSFAGPFDITLVKLDTRLEFSNTVRIYNNHFNFLRGSKTSRNQLQKVLQPLGRLWVSYVAARYDLKRGFDAMNHFILALNLCY